MEIPLLTEFCKSVRGSTIKRLEMVPKGYENWKVSTGALSFAEIAKHIIDLDNWLSEKIKDPHTKSIETETAVMKHCTANEYEELVIRLKETLEKKLELINTLDENKLKAKMYDDAYNCEVSLAWLILRRNIDHEIHHRGQIAVYLRVLKDKNVAM
ncbi:MAG: DinB family protein [Bacteroidota bacterium]